MTEVSGGDARNTEPAREDCDAALQVHGTDRTHPAGVVFPSPSTADAHGRVFVGGDLEPETLLVAYRSGLFPMRQTSGELAWWSPDPRAVLYPDRVRVSHRLRRSIRRFEIRVDTAFEDVIDGCAQRAEGEYHWITAEIREAYGALHRLGWAHSVEAWTVPTPGRPSELAGGLYGVAIGGLFCGESMFHRRPDASKAALVGLLELLREPTGDFGRRLVDCQWLTPHLASLGATELSRRSYLARMRRALALPLPLAFRGAPGNVE
jgi:leucyl/phenylalanyl-tRNA--protein transferase